MTVILIKELNDLSLGKSFVKVLTHTREASSSSWFSRNLESPKTCACLNALCGASPLSYYIAGTQSQIIKKKIVFFLLLVRGNKPCSLTNFMKTYLWEGALTVDTEGVLLEETCAHILTIHPSSMLFLSCESQVKGLLKDKRLETLVDSDLQGNYIDDEVEQLIQVALLCTQSSPMERPKMSEVVRMLEGDGLAERWEEWQKDELFRQDLSHTHHPNTGWIVTDSISHLRPDELSGPRWPLSMGPRCQMPTSNSVIDPVSWLVYHQDPHRLHAYLPWIKSRSELCWLRPSLKATWTVKSVHMIDPFPLAFYVVLDWLYIYRASILFSSVDSLPLVNYARGG